jgi:hypothetical protein
VGISRNPSANLHKKILAVAKRAAVSRSVVSGQWPLPKSGSGRGSPECWS